MVMAAQLCIFTKKHGIVLLKCMKFMICKWYLNKGLILKNFKCTSCAADFYFVLCMRFSIPQFKKSYILLLCSTGNHIKYLIMNYDRKESEIYI